MSRQSRKHSETGMYHIIFRGISRVNIFEDEKDFKKDEQKVTRPQTVSCPKKLSLAEKLLREGKSVTDACYMSGFSDCSRFIRFFKEKYGKTPLQYKKELLS